MIRALLMIVTSADRVSWARDVITASGSQNPALIIASPAEAARYIIEKHYSPSHIVLDLGTRGSEVLSEIDALAKQCEPGTRVVAVGDSNDITLYREVLARGVLDYFPMPAKAEQLLGALQDSQPSFATIDGGAMLTLSPESRTVVFMSAASGDGASTAALNTAFALSQLHDGKTVLVDMDYQFGMVAKHLALQNQYGLRELFDHPERGVDARLIKHMVATYDKLHVITAPPELRFLPNVRAESIREMIATLKQSYEYVVLDLPHVWLPWVATAIQEADRIVLVAQLWLKSVSHAARLMRVFREHTIPLERVSPIINRSGAKYKEAIDPKDFERVCGAMITFTLANDIKTIVAAESGATTVMQLPPSDLARDIMRLARDLSGMAPEMDALPEKRQGLTSLLKEAGLTNLLKRP